MLQSANDDLKLAEKASLSCVGTCQQSHWSRRKERDPHKTKADKPFRLLRILRVTNTSNFFVKKGSGHVQVVQVFTASQIINPKKAYLQYE